ncbi:hypothetical protein KDW49_17290 [Burkholderia dolosa]|uniref:hypothetical protein n=1 Tax=Burkholderia dolosa TaxID=152500 RepID=UPI001B9B6E68|nr:hypothetical protein [Burkholderia dolosa]MBR8302464.1 hypothetical protein [Burkholderia dolosa]
MVNSPVLVSRIGVPACAVAIDAATPALDGMRSSSRSETNDANGRAHIGELMFRAKQMTACELRSPRPSRRSGRRCRHGIGCVIAYGHKHRTIESLAGCIARG